MLKMCENVTTIFRSHSTAMAADRFREVLAQIQYIRHSQQVPIAVFKFNYPGEYPWQPLH